MGKYSLVTLFKMSVWLMRSKLIDSRIRLIRFPIDIRGRKYIDFGNRLTTGRGCRIEAQPQYRENKTIFFGSNVELNDYVHITGIKKVVIGNNVLIASKVFISDSSHGTYTGDEQAKPDEIPNKRKLFGKPVIIEDNVWLGENVAVLQGVRIGKGSVIGTSAVVVNDIPQNSIAVGIPAKVIKEYNLHTKKWENIG